MKLKIKYLIIGGISLLSFTGVNAQISGGIEGAVTTSSVKIKEIPNSFVNVVNGDNITGYEAGVFLKLSLGMLYVKPKVLYSHQSGTAEAVYPDESTASFTMKVNRFDIPLLIGLHILGPLSIEAGPVFTKIVSATENVNGSEIDIRPGGMGYRVGANAQLGMIGLNVAYQGVKNNSTDTQAQFESPNQLIFGASLSFGK